MNVLIVEDEYKELLFLTSFIRRTFPDMNIVGSVNNGKAALEAGNLYPLDLALLDIELPVHDGLYVAEKLKNTHPGLRIIILTAYSTFQYAQKAIRVGVSDYLVKPYLEEELEEIIRKLVLSTDYVESLCHSFPFLSGCRAAARTCFKKLFEKSFLKIFKNFVLWTVIFPLTPGRKCQGPRLYPLS